MYTKKEDYEVVDDDDRHPEVQAIENSPEPPQYSDTCEYAGINETAVAGAAPPGALFMENKLSKQ